MSRAKTSTLSKAYADLSAYNHKLVAAQETKKTDEISMMSKTAELEPVKRVDDQNDQSGSSNYTRNKMVDNKLTDSTGVTTVFVRTPVKSALEGRTAASGVSFVSDPQDNVCRGYACYHLEKHSIGDWAEWSMVPHSTQEIRERLLTRPIDETCISYLCRFSKIEPDFLDEFVILSTGYFHDASKASDDLIAAQPIAYSEASMAYYKALLNWELSEDATKPVMPNCIKAQLPRPSTHDPNKRPYSMGSFSSISDKIDWFYIARWQHFSDEILQKYSKRAGIQMMHNTLRSIDA